MSSAWRVSSNYESPIAEHADVMKPIRYVKEGVSSNIKSNPIMWTIILAVTILILFIWIIILTVKAYGKAKEKFTPCQCQDYTNELASFGLNHALDGGSGSIGPLGENGLKYGVGAAFFEPRTGATEHQSMLATKITNKRYNDGALEENEYGVEDIISKSPESLQLRSELAKKEFATLTDLNN